MEIRRQGVEMLKDPVWFDTGRKMKDGTPRTVAAYDTKELAEYKDKKSYLGTFDEDGAEEYVLWKRIGKASEVVKAKPAPNNGVTTTPAARGKKEVEKKEAKDNG